MIPYLYVFVRTDIPLRNQLVQVGHACHIAGRDFQHPDHTHLVLLRSKDEKSLLNIANTLDSNGIRFSLYHEGNYPKGYTALATEPIYGDNRGILEKYKLWDLKENLSFT